ncbi:MAG: RES domain-containing protein [Pirellulales bacterium]|nr:RES domain-containing protein [Pirellulales bacterium]
MLHAWRIFKAKYAATAFSGEGSRMVAGRWHSKGVPVVYTSENLALAVLETFVNSDPAMRRDGYRWTQTTFAESLVQAVDPKSLPKYWQSYPAPLALRKIGDDWFRQASSAVLKVPSAIVALEFNYLLNPLHPDFKKITIGSPQPFLFDPRLKK